MDEPPKEIWERRKLGLELRQKYELYFLSLAFTLAGLSVQAAQTALDIFGGFLFVVAGLVALWRVRRLWRREVGVAEHQETGTPNTKELEETEKSIRYCEVVQYGLFILGLALVGISRFLLLDG
jgi:hypothetical protein